MLDDNGTTYNDVAYVLISHGATGYGAYTSSGQRLPMPIGNEERANAQSGKFTIKAFSDAGTTTAVGGHFDDLLIYRRFPDLVKRINMEPRDWPDTITSTVLFDNMNVAAALGTTSVSPGDLGTPTLNFPGGVSVTGSSGGSPLNLSYGEAGGVGGIGVGGFDPMISSFTGEIVGIELAEKAARFAVTLNHFGRDQFFGSTYRERAQFTFFSSGAQVGTPITKTACRDGDGLASFEISPPGVFDAVQIRAVSSTNGSGGFGFSSFLISEFAACKLDSRQCRTTLANGSNTCS